MASITGWKPAWPAMTAASMISSESSLASDSDHQHGVGGAGDDEVEVGGLGLVDRRVHLELAVDVADAGAADRAHEGHAGQRQRRGGGDHGQHVRIVLEVMAQNRDDDLGFVAIAVGEERADRTVDQARDQRLTLGGTALALEIAAGNAAGREGLFLIVHGEREEVLAGLGRLGRDDRGEHGGFAVGGEHRAVGLAGDAAGLQRRACARTSRFPRDESRTCFSLSWMGKRHTMSKTARRRLKAASDNPAMARTLRPVGRAAPAAGPDFAFSRAWIVT